MLPRNVPTWMGKSEHVLSVTSRAAIRCQYNAAGDDLLAHLPGHVLPGQDRGRVMSQHFFETTTADGTEVTVIMGYDRPSTTCS
jgi:hypothetical protein